MRLLALCLLGSSRACSGALLGRLPRAPVTQHRSAVRLTVSPDVGEPGAPEPPDALQSQGNETGTAAGVALAGLAASGATVSAITTAAGGVCVGGGCVAGAGVAASAAGATGAAAGASGAVAAAFGGLQSWLAGGLVAAGLGSQLLTGEPAQQVAQPGSLPPVMADMVRSSTPIEAIANGRPTVLEFYRPNCPRCNRLAPSLQVVEQRAQRDGVNWVMLNTDEPASVPIYTKYGVSELCAAYRCACTRRSGRAG